MKDTLYRFAVSIDANQVGIPKVAADQGTTDRLVSGIFFVAGAVAILFIIINAFRYVISQGDAGKVAQAKDGILYSLGGLVVVALAFAIVQLTINVIRG